MQVYNDILEPFILVFTKEGAFQATDRFDGKSKDEVLLARMYSLEYRQTAVSLALFASDDDLRAYNDMQCFYQRGSEQLGQ